MVKKVGGFAIPDPARNVYDRLKNIIYTKEQLEELAKTIEDYKKGIADGTINPWDHPVAFSIDGDDGYSSNLRSAFIFKDKRFLDIEKGIRRLDFDKDNNPIFYIKKGEYLPDLIEEMPHGLVDKKGTGIGATTLEIRAKRNSVIVMPTRALAKSKADKENTKQEKEVCLYVGSWEKSSVSKQDIDRYLNDSTIEYKKLLVVADSLKKVVEVFNDRKEDFREWFLMVDEIDMLQSDSNYRPQLEDIIDYYLYTFKLARRCMVSATVKDFTHPELKLEQEKCLVTITYRKEDMPKRDIDLIHTNNIHKLAHDEIIKRLSTNPDDKILVAYNSIGGILKIISLLNQSGVETKKNCGVLCSESSAKEVDIYYTRISNKDTLDNRITFMTCAYFAGIDIEDKCHLITISNIDMAYAVLPLNKITQIHGRCRKGILSDTIIYNTDPTLRSQDIIQYRDELLRKAKNIVELLHKADELKKDDKTLEELFKRIKYLITEKAGETLFSQAPFPLVRTDINNIDQIAYFNIDALCEKMEAHTTHYSFKTKLYVAMQENHTVNPLEKLFDADNQQKETEAAINEFLLQREQEELIKAKDLLLSLYEQELLSKQIDYHIRNAKRKVAEFYRRVKKHYEYIEIETLCNKLLEISNKNSKAYRNLNNALSFWALDDKHSFKLKVMEDFKIGQKYSTSEIAAILNPIIFYHFYKNITENRALGLFHAFFDYTYTQGKYRIKGTNPLNLPKPLSTISEHETQLNRFFEVKLVDENPYKKLKGSPIVASF